MICLIQSVLYLKKSLQPSLAHGTLCVVFFDLLFFLFIFIFYNTDCIQTATRIPEFTNDSETQAKEKHETKMHKDDPKSVKVINKYEHETKIRKKKRISGQYQS